MISRNRTLSFIPILVLLLSCQTVMRVVEPTIPATHQQPTIVIHVLPSQTLQPTASLTTTITIFPTAKKTSTPTLFKNLTSTPDVLFTPSQIQLDIFEELWHLVNDEYLYADFNGLDWNAVYEEYSERVKTGMSNEEFYLSMDEMIAQLGDDHSIYLSPDEAVEEDAQYSGNNNYVGIGVIAIAVPERDLAVIILSFPNSPADIAGLKSHDIIEAVNGEPVIDEDGYIRDIIRGPEGSELTLTVQTPGETTRQVEITRRRIKGAIPVPYQVLTSPDGQHIGYLMLVTLGDRTIDEQVENALRIMNNQKQLDGLIIDNRQNEGGADDVLMDTLSFFTEGSLGYFTSRDKERLLNIVGRDISGSQEIPLVLLIGKDTVSYGEIMSGVLKDNGRAYLIGETTSGNVETLWGYDFVDGSRAWIAHESFRPYNHPEDDWEAIGILPHQIVLTNWYEFTIEQDPAVTAALSYFDGK